ncbi:SRPBCC family protein [Nocardia bovistercoris]|uniref:SRPBCC family protein n=1 Tax=Nocardia bovistercoris TaxID=2785916 RepID=A0A931N4Z6_9NOCA|nr:SRPBCC family protein [Nocardia bovistercoris]MBH0779227.1 SRPBCC family protein [Nocardia bovistercoris]
MQRLQAEETLSSSTEVDAEIDTVYALVSDVTRIPEWSTETVRVRHLDAQRFRSWNRRRLGVWRTDAEIVESVPGQRFSFVVKVMGGDWTQWTYLVEPGAAPGTTRLTETFRMCVALPNSVLAFERLFLFVRDRRTDLQANLDASVARIKSIAEADARVGDKGDARVGDNGDARVRDNGDARVRDNGDARVRDNGDARVRDNGDARVRDNGDARVRDKGEPA